MAQSKLIAVGHGEHCRMRLGLVSLVGLMSLVGFCAGIIAIPLIILAQWDKLFGETFWIGAFLFTVAAAPVVGALNGALWAFLGYPLYRMVTRRVNVHTYSGEFDVLTRETESS